MRVDPSSQGTLKFSLRRAQNTSVIALRKPIALPEAVLGYLASDGCLTRIAKERNLDPSQQQRLKVNRLAANRLYRLSSINDKLGVRDFNVHVLRSSVVSCAMLRRAAWCTKCRSRRLFKNFMTIEKSGTKDLVVFLHCAGSPWALSYTLIMFINKSMSINLTIRSRRLTKNGKIYLNKFERPNMRIDSVDIITQPL